MDNNKKTPLYENHVALGGKMVAYGGWSLPVQYSAILAEHKAVREHCGVFDVSHMGEITVEGTDALAFLQMICTNDFANLAVGRCRYSPVCYANGGTVDDVIVYKRAENAYLVIVNASNCEKDEAWFTSHAQGDVRIENISDQVAQIALQGAAYREVLAKCKVEGELPERPYAFTENIRINGMPCLVSTTGYTGEPGLEIYLRPQDAKALHMAMVQAGATPCGLGARDTLRFECGMPLYGHELSADITPLECGLQSFVKLTKDAFIGKEALLAPRKRMRIGLRLMDKGIARENCKVFNQDGEEVGFTTSGGPALTLGYHAAMALVGAAAAKEDTFFIEVRGRTLRAERVKLPFYKREA